MPKTEIKAHIKPEMRKKVVQMRLSGQTYKSIRKETGKSKSYVQRWVSRFKETGSLSDLKRKSKPTKVCGPIQKKILKLVRTNNRYSCRNLSNKLKAKTIHISKSTVHRVLQNKGFRNVKPKSKPKLTETQRKNRLEFAKKYKTKDSRYWKRVIFSDESVFEQGGNSQKVWVESGLPTPICETKNFNAKIQVWGAIGWKSKSPLFLIEQGNRLNAINYQEILRSTLIPNLQNISCKSQILLQDGASCHTARSTGNFLKQNKVETISPWPAQSPDLNVIENVWSLIKRRIDLTTVSTTEEIFEIVKKEWEAIPQSTIQKLIESMQRRIEAVISAKGGNTKY